MSSYSTLQTKHVRGGCMRVHSVQWAREKKKKIKKHQTAASVSISQPLKSFLDIVQTLHCDLPETYNFQGCLPDGADALL